MKKTIITALLLLASMAFAQQKIGMNHKISWNHNGKDIAGETETGVKFAVLTRIKGSGEEPEKALETVYFNEFESPFDVDMNTFLPPSSNGTVYEITVVAIDEAGNRSEPSLPVLVEWDSVKPSKVVTVTIEIKVE